MHEIRQPAELSAFYRFAIEHSDVWAALEKQRLEHSRLGSGSLERFIPSVNPKSESVIEVRFDAPAGSDADAKLKRLSVRTVFDNNLLESLAVPPLLMGRFRTFTVQENWKKDWRKFEEVLEEHRIEHLYHFTDSRNLRSIRKHGGLYSWWQCRKIGIDVPAPGGNKRSRKLDEKNGLEDYVRLSFNHSHPMKRIARGERRVRDLRIVVVDVSVIYQKQTLFSDMNANDKGVRVGGDLESFEQVPFDIATAPRWDGVAEKKAFQAEVLVKNHVPLDLIKYP